MNAPVSQLKKSALVERAMLRLHSQIPAEQMPTTIPEIAGTETANRILRKLARRLDLSIGEQLALALCYAVQVDPYAARLVAQLQAPIGGAQPFAGLVATLFADQGLDLPAIISGRAVAAGLISIGDANAPMPERPLDMPLHVVAAMGGQLQCPGGMQQPDASSFALPASLQKMIAQMAGEVTQSLKQARSKIFTLRCQDDRDGKAIAAKIAAHAKLQLVQILPDQEGADSGWLHAADALCLIMASAGPGENREISPPRGYSGPVIVVAGNDGSYNSPVPIAEWKIATPDRDDREKLWKDAGLKAAASKVAARRYRHGAARIAELSAAIENKPADQQLKQLGNALLSGSSPLDKLARRSHIPVARDDIILPDELDRAIERLRLRIAQRNLLAETLGPTLQARYRPGVRALFTGDSGTGKTLAAHWLSGQAGLPLYRVDLSALTSKWIGETEKNLSSLLDLAEHADVMLFFDEADSLFGARTDVGDSHDRFANAQTNFLLQRIEEFDGVALLATNSRDRFDPAFVRRLDAILDFPLPDAAARCKIWQTHLGDRHDLSDMQLNRLATEVDLAGGHVRNIVLAAASMAMSEGRAVGAGDLKIAAAEEYMKLGRAPPPMSAC